MQKWEPVPFKVIHIGSLSMTPSLCNIQLLMTKCPLVNRGPEYHPREGLLLARDGKEEAAEHKINRAQLFKQLTPNTKVTQCVCKN